MGSNAPQRKGGSFATLSRTRMAGTAAGEKQAAHPLS
jgi:hypothetical protein